MNHQQTLRPPLSIPVPVVASTKNRQSQNLKAGEAGLGCCKTKTKSTSGSGNKRAFSTFCSRCRGRAGRPWQGRPEYGRARRSLLSHPHPSSLPSYRADAEQPPTFSRSPGSTRQVEGFLPADCCRWPSPRSKQKASETLSGFLQPATAVRAIDPSFAHPACARCWRRSPSLVHHRAGSRLANAQSSWDVRPVKVKPREI